MKKVYILLLVIFAVLVRKIALHLGGFYHTFFWAVVGLVIVLIISVIIDKIAQHKKDNITKKMIHPFDSDLVSVFWYGIGTDGKDKSKNICLLFGNKMVKISFVYRFIFVNLSKLNSYELELNVNQQRTVKFSWFAGLNIIKNYQL